MKRKVYILIMIFLLGLVLIWVPVIEPKIDAYGSTKLSYNDQRNSYVVSLDETEFRVNRLYVRGDDVVMHENLDVWYIKLHNYEDVYVSSVSFEPKVWSRHIAMKSSASGSLVYLILWIILGAAFSDKGKKHSDSYVG